MNTVYNEYTVFKPADVRLFKEYFNLTNEEMADLLDVSTISVYRNTTAEAKRLKRPFGDAFKLVVLRVQRFHGGCLYSEMAKQQAVKYFAVNGEEGAARISHYDA